MSTRLKKPISWLLTLVMLFTMAMPVSAAEVMPLDDSSIAAPVWPDNCYTFTSAGLTISQWPVAKDDYTLVYKISPGGDDYWFDQSMLAMTFSGLDVDTEYTIEACYATGSFPSYTLKSASATLTVKATTATPTPDPEPVLPNVDAPTWSADCYTATKDSITINTFPTAKDKYTLVYQLVQNGTEGTNWVEGSAINDSLKNLTADTEYKIAARYAIGSTGNWTTKSDSGVLTAKTLADTPGDVTAIAAPVWPTGDCFEVTSNSFKIVKGPELSADAQALGAQVAFRWAKADAAYPDGSKYWNWKNFSAFQTLATLQNLNPGTEYKVEAVYITNPNKSDFKVSQGAEIKVTTAADPGNIKVKVRIVGATEPTATPEITATAADYKGAKYQIWSESEQTVDIYNSETSKWRTFQEIVQPAFAAVQFKDATKDDKPVMDTLPGTASNLSLIAPEKFGGHTLSYLSNGNDGTWAMTWLDKNGTNLGYKTAFTAAADIAHDGDTLVFHYVFKPKFEASDNSADGVKFNWLKATAPTEGELAAAALVKQIDAIGEVTVYSKAAIEAAEAAYKALDEDSKVLVTNYATLTAARAKLDKILEGTQTKLTAPTITVKDENIKSNQVTLTIAASAQEEAAKIETCYSTDHTNWTDWKEETTIKGLQSGTKYYFKARYVATDLTKYTTSDASAVAEATTTTASTVSVDSFAKLKQEMESTAAGTEKVIKLTADIEMSKADQAGVQIPAGSNVVLDGDGHTFLFTTVSRVAGLEVNANATLTLKNIVMGNAQSIGEFYSPGNNWCNMVRFKGDYSTVNIDGAVLYSCGGNGIIRNANQFNWEEGKNGVTVNIYSGVLYSIGRANYNNLINLQNSGTVNIIPKGDIMLEGAIFNSGTIKVAKGDTVKSAMALADMTGDYTAMSSDAVAALNAGGTLDYKSGVRIFTSDKTVSDITAPVVKAADAADAATADITYTVGNDKVVFTVNKRDTDRGVLMMKQGDGFWRFSSDAETGKFGTGNVFTFSGLSKDTEYEFSIQTATLHPEYKDGVTKVKIKTTYTAEKLTAPELSMNATKTANSITLTAPAASTEDTEATVQYRMSTNGTDWGEWQDSAVFSNLTAGTEYYFQAKYVAKGAYWLESDPSESVKLATKAPQLTAPTLTNTVTATATSIKLTAPATSTQDATATVMYRKSADGSTWGDWQSSAEFTGLDAATTYYFQAKYAAGSSSYRDSEVSKTIAAATAVPDGAAAIKLNADKTTVTAGKTFDVKVEMANNPGLVGMKLVVSYSDSLELVGAKDAALLPNGVLTDTYANPYILTWRDSNAPANITKNGLLATLTFKVKDTATDGSVANITVKHKDTDIIDLGLNSVTFNLADANVAISNPNSTVDPVEPGTVPVYVTYSDKGTLVTGKDNTELYRVKLNVTDADQDGKYTIKDAFVALHDKYYSGGKAGFGTSVNGQYTYVGKFWGVDSAPVSYTLNHQWVENMYVELKKDDVVDVYIWKDDSGNYADLYTWFEKDKYSATVGNEMTFTVKGQSIMWSNATKHAYGNPEGATVTVLDANGKVVSGYENIKVDANGQFKVKFTNSGTYTLHVDGLCNYTMTEGFKANTSVTNATVVPCRTTVTVTSAGGSGGGGGGGGATTTKPDDKKDDKQDNTNTGVSSFPFDDVKTGAWYYDAVKKMYEQGLMNGESAKAFAPNNKLSRAMLVTILYRMENEPTMAASAAFADVPNGQWFTKAVAWASGKAIVNGVGEGKFAPNDSITRQELAAMLYRYAKAMGLDVSATADLSGFKDAAQIADWAVDAIKWAVGSGLMKGNDDGTINPNGTATRAEVATIITRLNSELQ